MRQTSRQIVSAVTSLIACLLPSVSPAAPLAITNVNIVDVENARRPLRLRQTVIVDDGRIVVVGPVGRVKVDPGARTVDGSGKFLIPGLWDMHVHMLQPDRVASFATLFITNGVTTVRDLGTSVKNYSTLVPQVRAMHEQGTAPRLFAGGPVVDGKPSRVAPMAIEVSTPEDARAAVRTLKEIGADFVKVYNRLAPDQYAALVDEAQRQSLHVTGHIPWQVSAQQASEAGQHTIEHLGSNYAGVLLGASTNESMISKRVDAELQRVGSSDLSILKVQRDALREMLEGYDDAKATGLFSIFRKNGTWHVPTLVVLRSFAYRLDPKFMADERMKYLPSSIASRWREESQRYYSGATPEDIALAQTLYRKQMATVGAMHQQRVKIVAGTDVLNPYVFPGFSMHDELELLVEAGLTPHSALRAATIEPATMMSRDAESGSIKKGKHADLVLLEGNPLDAIAHTRRIGAVVVNGRLLTKDDISSMQRQVEQAATAQPW